MVTVRPFSQAKTAEPSRRRTKHSPAALGRRVTAWKFRAVLRQPPPLPPLASIRHHAELGFPPFFTLTLAYGQQGLMQRAVENLGRDGNIMKLTGLLDGR